MNVISVERMWGKIKILCNSPTCPRAPACSRFTDPNTDTSVRCNFPHPTAAGCANYKPNIDVLRGRIPRGR